MQRENPPAFPNSVPIGFQYAHDGMTLRDWFASRAPEPPVTWWGGGKIDCAGYALWNYQYADAMLAERERRADDAE